MQQGHIVAANVVDHVTPHRGNHLLFWDEANWQSLCTAHHSSTKSRIEHGSAPQQVGADGWPIDG